MHAVHNDETTKIRCWSPLWTWQENAPPWHVIKSLSAMQKARVKLRQNVWTWSTIYLSEKWLEEIRVETRKDKSLRSLSEAILAGWSEERRDTSEETHHSFNMRDELTVQDGLIFKKNSFIILAVYDETWRWRSTCHTWELKPLLARHVSWDETVHLNINVCREFDTWYPPNKNKQNKTKLRSHEIPLRPWKKIGTDISTDANKDYLVTMDYNSNFWDVDRLSGTRWSATVL